MLGQPPAQGLGVADAAATRSSAFAVPRPDPATEPRGWPSGRDLPTLAPVQPATEEELDPVAPLAPAPARCPVGSGSIPAAGGCPVHHAPAGIRRSKADLVVRRLLRIKDQPTGPPRASAYGSFQRSMLISAVRCTLTYVVFPFVAPAIGFATGVGPVVGIVIGSFAMACDVFTIRRFFAVDHKWRWPISTIAFSVICLLAVLLVQDVSHLLR